MTILELYTKFQIPKNLQRHMLRVAAVGQYISNHWTQATDQQSIITVLLMHDLGNLLKFNLEKGVDLFDEDERDLKHWQALKQEMKQKFSPDEHKATYLMAKQSGANTRVLELLSNIGGSNFQRTLNSKDWELKICSYADFRVGPHGFLTVQERFNDILKRYKGSSHALANHQETLGKMKLCQSLESQIQAKTNINLKKLPVSELKTSAANLYNYQI